MKGTNKLRDDIFSTFSPWDPEGGAWKSAQQRWIGIFGTAQRPAQIYGTNVFGKLDLFGALPASLWDKIDPSSSHANHNSELAVNLRTVLEKDCEVSLDSSGEVKWGNLPTKSLLNRLQEWVDTISAVAVDVSKLVLKAVGKAFQVGLISLLRLFDINPDEFQAALNKFIMVVKDLSDILGDIATHPLDFASELLSGGAAGLKTFSGKFPGNILGMVQDYVLGKLSAAKEKLPPLPTTIDSSSIILWLLGAAGLTKESIFDRLKQQVPAGQVQTAWSQVSGVLPKDWTSASVQQLFSKLDVKLDWDKIWKDILDGLPKILTSWVGDAFTGILLSFLFPVGSLFSAVWRGIKWVINQGAYIKTFLEAIGGALKEAAKLTGKVASWVVSALVKAAVSLITFLYDVLLKKTVGKLIDGLTALVNKIICWLRIPVDYLIEKLFGKAKVAGASCMLPGAKGMQGQMPSKSKCSSCFEAGTWVQDGRGGWQLVDELPVGEVVVTYPGSSGAYHAGDEWHLRVVSFEQVLGPDDWVKGQMLCEVAWLVLHDVQRGSELLLDLSEQGIEGAVRVTAVTSCPPLPEGEGRRVLMTLQLSRGLVYDLKVSGEEQVLGVTGTHPFWSVDRGEWVAAQELQVGERLLAWNGETPVVESLGLWTRPALVYNLQVEGDHCYRVGQQGLLVHNVSPGQTGAATTAKPTAPPSCVCQVSSVSLIPPGSVPSGVMFKAGELSGRPYRFTDLGPWNNTGGSTINYVNIHWVVWKGQNLLECLFYRRARQTIVSPNRQLVEMFSDPGTVKATGSMWTGNRGGAFSPSGRATINDYPDPILSGVFEANDGSLVVIADAPGIRDAQAGDFPFSFEVNFYQYAQSRADSMIKGQIYYNVVIRVFQIGDQGVVNQATQVATQP